MSLLSVIVPLRDEAGRLFLHLPRLLDWCRERQAELILCDDGSQDGSLAAARCLARSLGLEPVCLRLPPLGKGAAVAAGLYAARGEVRLMVDADVPVELADLDRLVGAVRGREGMVIGVRTAAAGRRHDGSLARRFLSAAAGLVSRTLLGGIRDSQCGCKVWTAATARRLCSFRRLDGFAFDFEQILCARRLGVPVAEVPVVWTPRPGSHVRPLVHGIRFARDVVRTFWLHRQLASSVN